MSATFEIRIDAIRTGTTGALENVIKRVEFTVKGTEAGQTFELPQSVDLSDPKSEQFVPIGQVTESAVKEWIEATFDNMPAVHAHIQYVLSKEVSKATTVASPLPWAPPVEPAPEPI